MKKTEITPEKEILFFDEFRFNSITGSAKTICDHVNKALTAFYKTLNQPKLKDLSILPHLLTGSSQAVFTEMIRIQQELKHPDFEPGIHKIISDSLMKSEDYKTFINLANNVVNHASHFNGTLPTKYYQLDSNGFVFVEVERAKVEMFTTFVDTPGKIEFIQVAENVADQINKLFQMLVDSGSFNYRTDVNEFLLRIQELLTVTDGKVTFEKSYLQNSNL